MSTLDHIAACGCTTDWVHKVCGKCLGCCKCTITSPDVQVVYSASLEGALAIRNARIRDRAPAQ